MPDQDTDPAGDGNRSDDVRLIEAYLAGQPEAVDRLECWIGAELAMRFPALAARAEEREDLCQTLHQRLLVNLRQGRFRHRSTLRTYVARITRYAAIDLLRYRSRRPEEQPPDGGSPPASDDTPEQAAQREDRRRLILRALQRSPEHCRQLWRLIFVAGLGYREIARRLGIPEGTVKSRAWTCRQRLSELLEQAANPATIARIADSRPTAMNHRPPPDDRTGRKDSIHDP